MRLLHRFLRINQAYGLGMAMGPVLGGVMSKRLDFSITTYILSGLVCVTVLPVLVAYAWEAWRARRAAGGAAGGAGGAGGGAARHDEAAVEHGYGSVVKSIGSVNMD